MALRLLCLEPAPLSARPNGQIENDDAATKVFDCAVNMGAKRAQIEAVKDLVAQVNLQLASLQGRIAGAVWAAGTIGAVVGATVGIGVQFLKR